jgi:hypothetical protein
MRRSVRTIVALVSAGAAVGYAAGRRVYAARTKEAPPRPAGSLSARAREAPRKLRALADLGVEQARHVVGSLPGSVRIVAAAPPQPDPDD